MRIKKEGGYKTVYWNEVGMERGGKAVDSGEPASEASYQSCCYVVVDSGVGWKERDDC
jgi:hypothetical protein